MSLRFVPPPHPHPSPRFSSFTPRFHLEAMQGATCMRAPWPSVGASNDSTIPARDMPVAQVAWPRQVSSNAMAWLLPSVAAFWHALALQTEVSSAHDKTMACLGCCHGTRCVHLTRPWHYKPRLVVHMTRPWHSLRARHKAMALQTEVSGAHDKAMALVACI